jgi:hypothetical protein
MRLRLLPSCTIGLLLGALLCVSCSLVSTTPAGGDSTPTAPKDDKAAAVASNRFGFDAGGSPAKQAVQQAQLTCRMTSDHTKPCEPGDWDRAFGSCCRSKCGPDARWHDPDVCPASWCGPLWTIPFEPHSSVVTRPLDAMAMDLSHMAGRFRILGHHDATEHEPGLDAQRAEAVRAGLVRAGLCADKLYAAPGGIPSPIPGELNLHWGGITRLDRAVPE